MKTMRLFLVALFSLASIIAGGQTAKALDISQESLVVSDQSPTITIHDAGIDNFKITPHLEFNQLNDYITYELTIKNNDGKKYQIVGITDDNTNRAITLDYAYPTTLDTTNKIIALTIKYVEPSRTPLSTITATIQLIDEDDAQQQIVIQVPNTGATVPNTGLYTVTDTVSVVVHRSVALYLVVIAATAFVYIWRKFKYASKIRRVAHKKSKIALFVILLLGFIPVITLAASSKDLHFTIEFSNVQFNGPYIVTFNANGGQPTPSDQTIEHGNTAVSPTEIPTKNGYTFLSWLDETNAPHDFTNTPITSHKTLTALYSATTYNISYNLNGGILTTPNPTTYTIETPDFTLTNPTKPNFVFKGWQELGSTTPEKTVTIQQGSTGDKSYEAIFIPTYTVTYDPAGGTVDPATILVGQGEPIGPSPTPEKTGYDFTGWYIGDTKIEEDYIVTEDITLTAKYTPTVYTITYDLNDGFWMGTNTNPTTYTVETETFTIEGRVRKFDPSGVVMFLTFLGWTGSNGTTPESTVTVTKGTTGNLTFTAVYLEQVKITFTSDISYGTIDGGRTNGNYSIQESVYYSGSPISTLPTVTSTRPLKKFSHWEIDNQRIDSNYIVNKTATAIAVFEDWTTVDVVEEEKNNELHDPSVCTDYGYLAAFDSDQNLRYVGQCPKNYVWFNCKTEPTGENYDYAGNCERWRIIGVFNNVSNGTKNEKRIKIIRDTSIGDMAMMADNVSIGSKTENWNSDQHDLRKFLNNTYIAQPSANATSEELQVFYNRTGKYPGGLVSTVDTSQNWKTWNYSNNLKPSAYNLIDNAAFYQHTVYINAPIGSQYNHEKYDPGGSYNYHFPSESNSDRIWIGKVGLPNMSDYILASAGGKYVNSRDCFNTSSNDWHDINSTDSCGLRNWMGFYDNAFTMNRFTASSPGLDAYQPYTIKQRTGGGIHAVSRGRLANPIHPVVYLKAGVTTGKGTGSYSDPYTLGPEN